MLIETDFTATAIANWLDVDYVRLDHRNDLHIYDEVNAAWVSGDALREFIDLKLKEKYGC